MKRSDYVKDFQAAWDDPETVDENCWRHEPHSKHLWRNVKTVGNEDVDETMRKCSGYCVHELPTNQCAECLGQTKPEKLTFDGLVNPSSHFHVEDDDSQDL